MQKIVPQPATALVDQMMLLSRIMIIDDEPLNIKIARKYLQIAGYSNFITTTDAANAMKSIRAEEPDVILLDVMMPNLDGLSACAAIRSQPETAAIPIIMVTTRGEERSIETAFRNGCTDYVTKPINGLELLAKLQNIFA